MKKILSLGLAVVMIVLAIASCNKTGNGDGSSTPGQSIPTPPASSSQSTPGSNPGSTPESTPNDKPAEIVFEDCDETVYVVDTMSGLWLRTATDFDDDSVKKEHVEYGTELRRIGKHETWSKVVYDNNEYFASSAYLSTGEPEEFIFEDVNEKVYVTEEAFIRSFPSRDDKFVVTSLSVDTELKRTGILFEPVDPENNPNGEYGWSRVEYDGQVCFMRNSVLSLVKSDVANTNEYKTYIAVKNFFAGLSEISVSGTVSETVSDGTDTEELVQEALMNAQGLGTDGFKCYMVIDETTVTYIDGDYYLDDGGIKVKMKMPVDEMADMFDVNAFVTHGFEKFTSVTVATEGETTVLTLKGISKELFLENVLGITKDMFETDAEYEAIVATLDCNEDEYTETFTLDKDGNVTAFTLSYSYSQTEEGTTITDSYAEENTVILEVEDITPPEDADKYIDIDEM